MKPAKEDETELRKAARKRFGKVNVRHEGYSDRYGHWWSIYRKDTWLARAWFGADGMPHFALHEDSE